MERNQLVPLRSLELEITCKTRPDKTLRENSDILEGGVTTLGLVEKIICDICFESLSNG